MAAISFVKKVSALPTQLVANTMYAVRVGNGYDLYVSDSTGAYAHRLNIPVDQVVKNTANDNRFTSIESRLNTVEGKAATNTTAINSLVTSDNQKYKDISVSNATITMTTGSGGTKQVVVNNVAAATTATNALYASTASTSDKSSKIVNTALLHAAIDVALTGSSLFSYLVYSPNNYVPPGTTVANSAWLQNGVKIFNYTSQVLPGQPTASGSMLQIPYDLSTNGIQIYIDQFGAGVWVRGGSSTVNLHTAEFKYIGGFS